MRTRWVVLSAVLGFVLVSPAAAQAPDVEYFPRPGGGLPFSEAVRVGSMLYLSGMVGVNAQGEVVAGGIEAETRQVLQNIREILERHGSSLDRVIRCLVMMADMSEWPRMNTVYATFFTTNLPARSAMGANGLALGARVEIQCEAVIGG